MKGNDDIKKELDEFSPLLSHLKDKGDGFSVPKNYFHRLPGQLLNRIREEKRLTVPETPTRTRLDQLLDSVAVWLQPRYAVSLATVALLIVAGFYFFGPQSSGSSSNDLFASLTFEEVSAYVASNIEEFDPELVIDAAGEIPNLELIPVSGFSPENLDQYMDELLEELDEAALEELL